MRLLMVILLLLLLTLQSKLWFSDGGVIKVRALNVAISAQQEENAHLRERNAALAAEVEDLRQGLEAIEERARTELGMIIEGETFFQLIEKPRDAEGAQ